jgi:uncharacterized protein
MPTSGKRLRKDFTQRFDDEAPAESRGFVFHAMLIEHINEKFLDNVLALNNAHARELSYLTGDELRRLIGEAFYARSIGGSAAFIITFDQSADYESPNFLWFKQRHSRFVYVDRIAVAASARGQGLARKIYLDLFGHAKAAGHGLICCEVNADPPNPASDAFHAALGFRDVGRAEIHDGQKTVRYFERDMRD